MSNPLDPVRSSSDAEAKHLQLSTGQLEKSMDDYARSTQALATLTANSVDHEKCSSTNTSLNSTMSSTSSSSTRSCPKVPKINRSVKQSKTSPIKTDPAPTVIDDYPSALCYNTDDYYYSPNPPSNYTNLALYSANYSSPSCFSALNQTEESLYYDSQQQKKRIRLDNDHHHHVAVMDYESNGPYEKMNFYSSPSTTANCYVAANNYPTDHPYHHTSVIVDSQQYFLNGWNGTTAF